MITAQPPSSTTNTRVGSNPAPTPEIPRLQDFIKQYHGAIRSVDTCTDIADRGTNIVSINYSDSTQYKVAINSADEAVRAYRHIRRYVIKHECVGKLIKFRVVFNDCVRQKEDIDRVYEHAESVLSIFRPKLVEPHPSDLNILAAQLGLSHESAKKALEREAARSAVSPETVKRRGSHYVLTPVRLRATYEALLENSQFANPSLEDHERLREARALVKTYDRLREHDSTFKDGSDRLRAARKLVNGFAYQRRKLISANPQ